ITETFGLTYIEAMSQGLPIIYSKEQGIDGYFENGLVGYSVNPLNIEEIANCIIKVINNYDYFASNAFNTSSFFKWEDIIDKYVNTYESILT
ncbi:MAG: glycosyltransferase, partial [Staphylococcus equorum]|nr:glycosyltransferase [Staphylococcus equorum]